MLRTTRVADTGSSRVSFDIRWAAIFKLLAAAALVWLWLKLIQLVLVVVVAVLLAVTLNPVVDRLERRGWARGSAAVLIVVMLIALLGGFAWLTWSSVSDQASFVSSHFLSFEQDLVSKLPSWVTDATGTNVQDLSSHVATSALSLGRSAISAVVVGVLGLILMMYLVVEAEPTIDWLLAFVPKQKRGRAQQTIAEAQRVIFAY